MFIKNQLTNLLLCASILILTACGSDQGNPQTKYPINSSSEQATSSSAPASKEGTEYTQNYALWQSASRSEIEFDVNVECACSNAGQYVFRSSGQTDNSYYENSLASDSELSDMEAALKHKKIEGLFALISHRLNQPIDAFHVEYNVDLGYPSTLIYTDAIADNSYRITVSPPRRREALERNDAQMALWLGFNLQNYSYESLEDGFPFDKDTFHITVRNGEVTKVLRPDGTPSESWQQYYTLNDLFQLSSLGHTTTYNATYGFPESVYVRHPWEIQDLDRTYYIKNFQLE